MKEINSLNDEILNLYHKMQNIASNLNLLDEYLRQLGFEHDYGCWRYKGEKNSLFLVVIHNQVEIGLCVGNKEGLTPSRVFRFFAGSLYANTITESNIETVKEDIKNIVDSFKKQETLDYVVNRFSCLKDFELVVTLTNKDVDLRECLEKVKTLETDKHFIIFDTAIYGGFCENRFIMKGINEGKFYDDIYSMPEDYISYLRYREVDGCKTICGGYDLRKQLNLLLYRLKSNNFFQCDTTNLEGIIADVNIKDVEFKHPEYSVTEF